MLTGLLQPSKGHAVVYGKNVALGGTSKFFGVCPQHNILFDLLTVREHLEFYAALRDNTPKALIKAEVDRYLVIILSSLYSA